MKTFHLPAAWFLGLLAFAVARGPAVAEGLQNLLVNPFFEGEAVNGVPRGWSLYGGLDGKRRLGLAPVSGGHERGLWITDDDPAGEVGVTQRVPARGGEWYRATVRVRQQDESGSVRGAYLQMRFLPSGRFEQRPLRASIGGEPVEVSVIGQAPAGTTHIELYIYTHREPTPRLVVDGVVLVDGAAPLVPPPVVPSIERVRPLHRRTPLVEGGRPTAVIVAPASGRYDAQARAIQAAVRRKTGVTLPIVRDSDPAAGMPLAGHVILLGNRSTNAALSELYDRYFTLLDLKYPGAGGFVLRSLHNPFGNGHNAILVGGSEDEGVQRAADALIAELDTAGDGRDGLSLGWLMKIRLSPAYEVPESVHDVQTWEASLGYGSSGYFGWNTLSKYMALYYMTGREEYARRFVSLAFPDEQAQAELAQHDGEMIENKRDPLAGPYHYNAHMMILYWDLIEESPVFTDDERLRITRAFARQLTHRLERDPDIYHLTGPPDYVGSRHAQWSAIALMCLGRYFSTHYPHPVWQQCYRAGKWHFQALHQSAWVIGETDNLYWYATGVAPVLSYVVLSGDRTPVHNGALAELLRGQEALLTGRDQDWAIRYASLGYLLKAAYLTGDGRWLHYMRRTGLRTDVFRLGQSFWPGDMMQPKPPIDLVGRWTVSQLPEPAWRARRSGIPREVSFNFASFRSHPEGEGDFILLDGYNAASRNPYHTFTVLELRIDGQTILCGSGATNQGYLNQVLTKAGGMVEPTIAMDAALTHCAVVGQTATATGETPGAAYGNWKRTVVQRVGRYALFLDEIVFDHDAADMEVQTLWQGQRIEREGQRLLVFNEPEGPTPADWITIPAKDRVVRSRPGKEKTFYLAGYDIVVVRSKQVGDFVELGFELSRPVRGELYAEMVNYNDRGRVRFELDGEPIEGVFNHYAESPTVVRIPLGERELTAGVHTLRIEVAGLAEGVERAYIAVRSLLIRPAGATVLLAQPTRAVILSADPIFGTTEDGVARLYWRGDVRRGQVRRAFSLIVPLAGKEAADKLACLRLDENTAALALPEPALAVAGKHEAATGDLVIVAASHLFGKGLVRAGFGEPLVESSAPVDVDWDFTTGTIALSGGRPAQLTIRAATDPDGATSVRKVSYAGEPLTLEGLYPGQRARAEWEQRLSRDLVRAEQGRRRELAGEGQDREPTGRPVSPQWTTRVGGEPAGVVVGEVGDEARIFVAVGESVHVLDAQGESLARWSADGLIRTLHFWREAADQLGSPLLLAGCANEHLIAFRPDGTRAWTFTSEMDPAVFEAGKQYWFKSAIPGIYGVGSGRFIGGRSQAFVGSACTLEILNPDGTLVRRLPIFWGPPTVFRLIDGPDGSRNLLVAREPTDGAALAIINSETLDPSPRGFHSVPTGHTLVPGWASMSRSHIFYDDLDGDGTREVVSEINGTWNRVTVWDASQRDRALASANFGPGRSIPHRNITDFDVGDLDGDGTKELIVSLKEGLVVTLDHGCHRLWSKRLPSPPTRLALLPIPHGRGGHRIVVACADGRVLALSAQGEVTHHGAIPGRATHAAKLPGPNGWAAVFATESGHVTSFDLGK